MRKSLDKMSSERSASETETLFSYKRYFINNLDSYHGTMILQEMSRILEKNAAPSRNTSHTMVAVGEDAEPLPPPPPEQPYEIIGTVSDPKIKTLDNVARIVLKADLLPTLLTCGTVILDVSYDREELRITVEYLKLLKDLLEKQQSNAAAAAQPDDDDAAGDSKKRYLILISTVMTWASTKPLDPIYPHHWFNANDGYIRHGWQWKIDPSVSDDTPELPFIETDFRKRKPHPNYKVHYDAENMVIGLARKHRNQIGAIVVCAGVTYGGREDVLFYWFQKAWECERVLPILGRGANVVPLINVLDLASIIYNLVTDFPKKLYILAVEQTIMRQREFIKPLGRSCGTGMFKCIPPSDAFLIPELDQRIHDLITLNLNMEPTFIVETMGLQWTSDQSFSDNVLALMQEFKKERGLKPFKIIVYGPPIVGKTTLAKQLCDAYGLVYISLDTAVQDVAEDLAWRILHWDIGETSALPQPTGEEEHPADDDDAGEEETGQEAARATLANLQSGRVFPEDELIGYLRQRLLCREALNRGWVLDGFPTTLAQCSTLFEKGDENDSKAEVEVEEEPFEEDVDLFSTVLKKLLPDIVVYLEASDDFICGKALRQPEGDTRLDEETVLKRLNEFRSGDARDVTPLNFFDELDIHPLVVPVKDHTDYGMKNSYAAVALRMGQPCRYGKLIALIEAAEKRNREELATQRSNDRKVKDLLEKKMREDREDKMEYWSELYTLMRDEEEAALAVAGEPMRNYLVHNIFPTLTPALLEVAKLRPEDPIDFLAEHLFKLNPTGKMLEPGYNLQAERILGKIKILDDALQDLDIKIDPLVPPEADLGSSSSSSKNNLNSMSAL